MSQVTTETITMPLPATKGRARVRYNQAMKLVRRAHLYAGLFMTPWVFLYGGTALLFNHPTAFPDQEIRAIAPADLAGTALATFPKPRELAGRVVEAINASAGEDEEAPAYRLVRPEEASFGRDYITTLSGGGKDHTVRLDLAAGSGTVRTGPRREEPRRETPPPFARGGRIRLEPSPMEALNRSLPAVLARLGLQAEPPTNPTGREGFRDRERERVRGGRPEGTGEGATRVGPRGGRAGEGPGETSGRDDTSPRRSTPSEMAGPGEVGAGPGGPGGPGAGRGQGRLGIAGPELTFLMEGGGKTWRVGYNLQTAALTGRPADAPTRQAAELSTRRFLTRLHMAHGYPSGFDSRWAWALSVDLMFVSMVGWGITGLLMWWQMKNLRRIGSIVLAASAVASTAVAIGMHAALVGGP